MTTPSKSILFIAAGGINWGSSRMRAFWVSNRIPGAGFTVWQEENPAIDDRYQAYVFQKVYNFDLAESIKKDGKPVFWDSCDPLWWWNPGPARLIYKQATGCVFSSPALLSDFIDFVGEKKRIWCIPDCIEPAHFKQKSDRPPLEGRPLRIIWFGLGVNRISLLGALANLQRLKANGVEFTLTIFDDGPKWDMPDLDVNFIPWKVENEVAVISDHDLAVLPKYPGPWGEVKSNNKFLTAAACGVPAVSGEKWVELYDVARSEHARAKLLEKLCELLKIYHISGAAQAWKRIALGVLK
jgi:glycosyltransferase involved in cell wall biosynthesis